MSNLYNAEKQQRTLKDIVDPYLPRKKHILPVLEVLTGITENSEKNLLSLAMAAPIIGKTPRILKDLRLSLGKTFEHRVNKAIIDIGMKGKYKKIGKYKTKKGNYDISVTEESLDINKKRLAKVVKLEDKERSITIFQPFYKSTGRGKPSIKSKGKWLPFEGVLPEKHILKYARGGEIKGQRAFWAGELNKGEMPAGWFIKAFKDAANQIWSTGSKKSGLPIHEHIGELVRLSHIKYLKSLK